MPNAVITTRTGTEDLVWDIELRPSETRELMERLYGVFAVRGSETTLRSTQTKYVDEEDKFSYDDIVKNCKK